MLRIAKKRYHQPLGAIQRPPLPSLLHLHNITNSPKAIGAFPDRREHRQAAERAATDIEGHSEAAEYGQPRRLMSRPAPAGEGTTTGPQSQKSLVKVWMWPVRRMTTRDCSPPRRTGRTLQDPQLGRTWAPSWDSVPSCNSAGIEVLSLPANVLGFRANRARAPSRWGFTVSFSAPPHGSREFRNFRGYKKNRRQLGGRIAVRELTLRRSRLCENAEDQRRQNKEDILRNRIRVRKR